MSEQSIKAYQGQPFTITLRANGGTNYTWCLTTLPGEAVFASKQNVPQGTAPGAPVDHVFTFLAVKDGSVKIGFKLLCWSNPEKDANEVLIDVVIVPHNNKDELGGFIRYSENSASYIVPPYAYNGGADSDAASKAILDYGFPGCGAVAAPVYNVFDHPVNTPPVGKVYSYPNSGANSVLKYGFPGCDAISCAAVKYGYPNCDGNAPARLFYGFYGCPPNIAYKYGYPGCDDSIIVKYGFPGCDNSLYVKYGYPGCNDNSVIKYGYPNCDAMNAPVRQYYGYYGCPPTVVYKYGYPGCEDSILVKYGFPKCEDSVYVKYGYPGCE